MNTELGRKITSLTLMTIMVAGGLSFAVPGAMPSAYAGANANLFVSAENPLFGNSAFGPQVIEVIVSDSGISSLDDAHGEPDVTVDGNKLRMLQATDGNWYGYFGEKTFITEADQAVATARSGATAVAAGVGLDYGLFCKADGNRPLGFSTLDSDGIAIPMNATGGSGVLTGTFDVDIGTDNISTSKNPSYSVANTDSGGGSTYTNGTQGTATFLLCPNDVPATISSEHKDIGVIRENKTLNRGLTSGVSVGNGMGISHSNYWPFIQLYTLTEGSTVDVTYNKGGNPQAVAIDWTADYDATW